MQEKYEKMQKNGKRGPRMQSLETDEGGRRGHAQDTYSAGHRRALNPAD